MSSTVAWRTAGKLGCRGWSLCSLVMSVVAVTGLSDLFGTFVEQIEGDATVRLDI
jgi:hypothetical protein